MTATYQPLDQTDGSGRSGCNFCKVLQCLCCLVVFTVLAGYGAFVYIGAKQGSQQMLELTDSRNQYCTPGVDDVDMKNITYNIWWPGCGYVTSVDNLSDGCTEPCVDRNVMLEMNELNNKLPSMRISYSSRNSSDFDTVELGGWWLPADEDEFPGPRPRIVVQHGFQSNSNEFRQQFIAFILRSLGYDVLLNNFRDHCYSDPSKEQIYQWGGAYPLDTLGAWDYAKDDPDSILGGPVNASQVGILGFSKGGFITLNVLGMEGQIPGLWEDASVEQPKTIFGYGFEQLLEGYGVGWLTAAVVDPAWWIILHNAQAAGVNLEEHTPATTLPLGPDTQRPVYMAHNIPDTTVPVSEAYGIKEILEKYPEKYKISDFWLLDDLCDELNHAANHLSNYAEYKLRLCSFWADVFGKSSDDCASGISASKDTKKEVKL